MKISDSNCQPESAVYGIREIANWLLAYADENDVGLSNMSLNKLVYFIHEYMLVKFSRRISAAKIEAWEHGPVFRELYRSFKKFGDKSITSKASMFDAKLNSVVEVEPKISYHDGLLMREAIDDLLRLPASILRDISHASGSAWSAVWYHEDKTNPGMEITDEIILTSSPQRNFFQ
ncbi:MAG: DUF4065 domain-containing protein [Parasphingorhabdus sp.]|nr:DUF4065 domain-containing protein [Parasphingorhabdus sp.]